MALSCERPFYLKSEGFAVGCGTCPACIKSRRMSWVSRLRHESAFWEKSVFITLTYNDDYLPMSPSGLPTLYKKDYQDFLKRFREVVAATHKARYPDDPKWRLPMKYFICGEYGAQGRPHYHMILFGVSAAELSPYDKWDGDKWVTVSRTFNTLWPEGFNTIGGVSDKSINYVASYCQKKLFGDKAKEFYKDALPPFLSVSQGLGLRWALEHEDVVKKSLTVPYGKYKVSVPRYYRKKLGIESSSYDDFRKESSDNDRSVYLKKYPKKGLLWKPKEFISLLEELRTSGYVMTRSFCNMILNATYKEFRVNAKILSHKELASLLLDVLIEFFTEKHYSCLFRKKRSFFDIHNIDFVPLFQYEYSREVLYYSPIYIDFFHYEALSYNLNLFYANQIKFSKRKVA